MLTAPGSAASSSTASGTRPGREESDSKSAGPTSRPTTPTASKGSVLQDIGATKVAHPTASSGAVSGTTRPGSKSTLLQEVASEGKSASEGRPAPVAVAGGGLEDSVGGAHPSDPAVLAARRAAVDAAPLGCGVDVQVSAGLGHATIVLPRDCMHHFWYYFAECKLHKSKKRREAWGTFTPVGAPYCRRNNILAWILAWDGVFQSLPSPLAAGAWSQAVAIGCPSL
jgi:hypothetical protein